MKLLKIGAAMLLALLLTFSTVGFGDQTARAATLECDAAIKLPSGWNTPGLDKLERITTFPDNDWHRIFDQEGGINLLALRIQKKDGYAQIGVERWYNQPTKIIVTFDIYFEVKGLGVYRFPSGDFNFTNVNGNYASNAFIMIQPPEALLEVRIGEVRVRPADEPAPSVDSVKLSATSLSLLKGKSAQLEASVWPHDANQAVSWKSSNTKVAKVDSTGLVKAVAAGTATITVTTKEGKKTAKCKVTVKNPIKLTSLGKPPTMFLLVGTSQAIKLTLKPKNATVSPSYSSANSGIASVDADGVVTAHSPGMTKITVKAGGKTQTFSVSTGTIPATAVRLNKTKGSIKRGNSLQLIATIQPETTSPMTIHWSSSDEKIAKVSQEGIVTARKKGTVTITAMTWNGLKATCKITVK